MKNKPMDIKRVYIYLAISFGIAWITGLVIFLTGGLSDSPKLGENVSLAFVLLATTYMGAPALANLLTRIITKEGWQSAYIRPNFKKGWLYWLLAWIGPGVLTLIGAAIFFLIFPGKYDPTLAVITNMIADNAAAVGQPVPEMNPWTIVAIQTVQAIIIAPLINGIPTFGEEFGWRAYLQPKLMKIMNGREAILLSGVIWGIWHWPVILMGHNYGLEYPGAPWIGLIAMVWFCIVLGTFISWVTLRAESVWPAVIAHAAINGIAGIGALFVKGEVSTILGPMPTGFIGSIGFSVVAMILVFTARGLEQTKTDIP